MRAKIGRRMTKAALVFPHQLFTRSPALDGVKKVILVEDPLFFRQYGFHRQKLLFHRVSMQRYAESLRERGFSPVTLGSESLPETSSLGPELVRLGVRSVQYVDPTDDWLGTRLQAALTRADLSTTIFEDDHFLTPISTIHEYAAEKKKLFFTDFYIRQRKHLGILVDSQGKPEGGKWSFDTDNRKKLPKNLDIPRLPS
ncbi:MAG: cryptochrome/photolyase family protein [Gemmataceae bacterium]